MVGATREKAGDVNLKLESRIMKSFTALEHTIYYLVPFFNSEIVKLELWNKFIKDSFLLL